MKTFSLSTYSGSGTSTKRTPPLRGHKLSSVPAKLNLIQSLYVLTSILWDTSIKGTLLLVPRVHCNIFLGNKLMMLNFKLGRYTMRKILFSQWHWTYMYSDKYIYEFSQQESNLWPSTHCHKTRHDRKLASWEFPRILKCSQITGVFYEKIIYGFGFFVCFIIKI